MYVYHKKECIDINGSSEFKNKTFTVESFYSWVPLSVYHQKFVGSSVRYFVGKWFVLLQRKTNHYLVILPCERKFVGKRNPRNPRTLIPRNNNDSTIL